MPRVIFFFAGTNETAEGYYKTNNSLTDFESDDDIIKIFIDGCQAPNVGGSAIDPNLNIVTDSVREAFMPTRKEGTVQLSLAHLVKKFGESIIITRQEKGTKGQDQDLYRGDVSSLPEETIKVNRVVLSGFSRGGWTAFQQAKKLNKLLADKKVPQYIVADQPVMGQSTSWYKTQVKKYHEQIDFSKITSLKRADIFYGDYHLASTFENRYFAQTNILLSDDQLCCSHKYVLPHQDHIESHRGKSKRHEPTTPGFLSRIFAPYGDTDRDTISPLPAHMRYSLEACVTSRENPDREKKIVDWYVNHFKAQDLQCCFTPKPLKQPIQGSGYSKDIQEDPYYFKALKQYLSSQTKLLSMQINTDSLTNESAYAIYHLLPILPERKELKNLVLLILSTDPVDKKKQEALITVMNDVGKVMNYMRYERTHKIDPAKLSQSINDYQVTVFEAVYLRLSIEEPDEKLQQNADRELLLKVERAEEKLATELASFPNLYLCLKVLRRAISNFERAITKLFYEITPERMQQRFFKTPLPIVVEETSEHVLKTLQTRLNPPKP